MCMRDTRAQTNPSVWEIMDAAHPDTESAWDKKPNWHITYDKARKPEEKVRPI